MHPLEAELRTLLENQTGASPADIAGGDNSDDSDVDGEIPVGRPISGYAVVIDHLPPAITADLSELVKRMIIAGLGKHCLHAYATWRSEFLQESISRLGFRPPEGDPEIKLWTKIFKVAVLIFFPSERRLADRVFSGDLLSAAGDMAVADSCRSSVQQLLAFPAAAAAAARNSPEKLFGLIDMYEVIRDLTPEIAAVFSGEHSSFVLLHSAAVSSRLAAAARSVFAELENLIRRDPASPPVSGGGVHSITKYVVNFLLATSRSRQTLEEIMDEDAGAAFGDQFVWTMDLLINNLEAKARIYRDPAQRCLFLLNNHWYIAKKTKDRELKFLLGEDWIRGQATSVRRWRSSFQRMTWEKVTKLLAAGDPESSSPAPAILLREKLQRFNESFREIYKIQAGWAVADEQLASELRQSAADLVLPAYQNFLVRVRSSPENGEKRPEKIVQYSPADVGTRINRLFRGNELTRPTRPTLPTRPS